MVAMERADELRIKLLVKQAVHEEMDEFYKKLALLLDSVRGGSLSPGVQAVLELVEKDELTADELAGKRGTSRAAAAQALGRLYELGLVEKVKKGKKVYYRGV